MGQCDKQKQSRNKFKRKCPRTKKISASKIKYPPRTFKFNWEKTRDVRL